ncbi:hypothetical protein [Streptomyces sp. NPDC056056]|uniref:hypothetical protein n=1 Tax=Streptomyces sp. NPDC056056 TaxID=3345698 RepID=UPI0035D6FF75
MGRTSEFAFANAFTRTQGMTPGTYRRTSWTRTTGGLSGLVHVGRERRVGLLSYAAGPPPSLSPAHAVKP